MSSIAAASLVLGFQIGLAMLVVAAIHPRLGGERGALAVMIAGTGLLAAQFGFFTGGRIPPAPIETATLNGRQARQACEDIADKLREVRVIVEERADGTVIVNGTMWNQIPAQVREGIEVCFNELAPANGEATVIPR